MVPLKVANEINYKMQSSRITHENAVCQFEIVLKRFEFGGKVFVAKDISFHECK